MKPLHHLLALCALLLLGGCFTIDKATLPNSDDRQIVVSNYGWYLFNAVPIACGNAAADRTLPWALFRDDVTLEKIQRRFVDVTKCEPGRELTDIAYKTYDSVMLELPGFDVPLPIPYFITYHEIQLSGVLK